MHRSYKLVIVLLAGFCTFGCQFLIPKRTELFQKKVPTWPETSQVAESQRVAADFLARKLRDSLHEGELQLGVKEASIVATPLSYSLGQPKKQHSGPAEKVSHDLMRQVQRHQSQLRDFQSNLTSLEGKKIEGTGLMQIGYFSGLLLVMVIIGILWFALKIVSIFNPPVAIGTKAVSLGANLLRRGWSEVLEGGEKFKERVKSKIRDPQTRDTVLELFREAQMTSQSRDVQDLVKELTHDSAIKVRDAAKEIKGVK